MNSEQITVTKPYLPPIEEFIPLLEDIWKSRWLTNQGKYHNMFEEALAEFLGVRYISLFANGTLGLITALQALRIKGDVITTPYSFVATSHALKWNEINPVFCDIEPGTCNINPDLIEAAITPQTSAILAVHVYGMPCNVEKIQSLADIYNLKVIYDSCHAFNVRINNIPVLNFGDLSILSFHATKVFTTFEGGAIISHDEKMKKRIDYLKNFGFADEVTVVAPGINAKMNEFQAAMGILQLKYFHQAIAERKQIAEYYNSKFKGIDGITTLSYDENIEHNFAYYPIFIDKDKFGADRDYIYNSLKKNNILSRRYFYPLISQFPSYKWLDSSRPENLPVAERITKQVLCLPIYPGLEPENVEMIVDMVLNMKKNNK
jgi:dTDP-4-amino-4,6-dideoxygalactose transaminase